MENKELTKWQKMEDGTEIENDEMVTRQSRLMVKELKNERQ